MLTPLEGGEGLTLYKWGEFKKKHKKLCNKIPLVSYTFVLGPAA